MTETVICSLCKEYSLATEADRQLGACATCAQRLGIIPMPPETRPRTPCQRCHGKSFVRAIPREHSSTGGEHSGQVSAPMYLTHEPIVDEHWLLPNSTHLHIQQRGIGLLEAYVCRKCGYVEWYCRDPEKIPIDPRLMTELISDDDTPYR